MAKARDHLEEHQETVQAVRDLRALLLPRDEGGYGLTFRDVAAALGMAGTGIGIRSWTGTYRREGKIWLGGRTLPTGARKAALRRYVHRMYLRWRAEAFGKVPVPPPPAG